MPDLVMRTGVLAILFFLTAFLPASAAIINVPDDYGDIQTAINASSSGDTVLVQPGSYVENINFGGHDILLTSLYLTTNDSIFISSTIIDGNASGSAVTFNTGEDSTAQLIGFTIKNGSATNGGGIYCLNSNPCFNNNKLISNSASNVGGGIYIEISDDRILHVSECSIDSNRRTLLLRRERASGGRNSPCTAFRAKSR